MRKVRFWPVVGVIAVVSGLLTAGAAAIEPSATPKPRFGGTAIFGADQEPLTLNNLVVGGDHAWTSAAHYPVFAGTYTVTPRFLYRPDLVTKVVFTRRPFSVTYHIKPNAKWSDGKPITADDYIFTWKTITDKRWNIISTIGYEDIRRATKIGRSNKIVKFTYKKTYAGWRDLFGEILPRHALNGEDINNIWKNDLDNPKTGKPVASGPFFLASWNRGSSMVFKRNERYWGPKAYLRQIIFRFIEDSNTQVQQLRGGEVDILHPQPQIALAPLRQERNLLVQTALGPIWEKLDFNIGRGDTRNPLLGRRFVRQAISHALNRPALVRTLFGWLNPRFPVLNSGIIMTSSAFYKEHWGKYNFSTSRARTLMTSNGCSAGGDGIFVCGGQRASFRWTGTTGNQRRELTFEIAQAQLKSAGIEIKADFAAPGVVFGRKLPSSDFDIIDYAYVSSSPDISGWDSAYGCRTDVEAQQNNMGYCNRNVDRLLKAANAELDQKKQAALTNQALALMSTDLPILPLYQLPDMLVNKRSLRNVIINPLTIGPFWNLNQGGWWKAA